MSTLAAALQAAERGFRVFPLNINGKEPAIADADWRALATRDRAKIESMWTCPVFGTAMDYNVGIALDANTLVIDVDVRDGRAGAESLAFIEAIHDPLPSTYEVETASGGRHLYYSVEGTSGAFPKQLAKNIDLQGEGRYVAAPGSIIDGRPYRALREGPIGPLELAPQWLCDLATAKRVAPDERVARASVGDVDSDYNVARATEWLTTAAPEAVEGSGGDNQTIAVINRVGDFGISEEMAYDLLLDHWNEKKAIPSWDPDDLRAKVRSAYKSRQNPVGVASPEAEFDAVEVAGKNSAIRKHGKLWLEWWRDAKPDLAQPYLIDDMYDLNTMVVTYGESNSGKTYVVLDQAFAIATGRAWNGHKVNKGLVVYVAAEGGRGFRKRIAAFRQHYDVPELPFALVPCPVDLFSSTADAKALVTLIREAEAASGEKCVMVVVDTLARAMGGGDENSGADMGVLLKNCDRIRETTGATFHLIHHSGKDKAKGARGWSGLRGHIDTEIEVAPGRVEVTKQRDLEKIKELTFALKGVGVGERADGRAVTACIVEWNSVSEFEIRVSPEAQQMLDILRKLIAARQDAIEADDKTDNSDKAKLLKNIRIPWAEWQAGVRNEMKTKKGKPIARQRLFEIRPELSNSGLIERDGKDQWFIPDSPEIRTQSE